MFKQKQHIANKGTSQLHPHTARCTNQGLIVDRFRWAGQAD